jgi:hypothetical protein
MLYLHEIIDIVGTGQEAYLATVAERARHSTGAGISRLMGTWKVIGSTNRWPRVVNMWEMDGWEQWADGLERQFVPAKRDAALAPWWAKATEWRSGGFDRILEPTAYSPTCAALRQQGLKAWVCVHTAAQLWPGKRDAYLAAIGETLAPVLTARGLTLMGAYAAPMRTDEAILLWAAPDFRHLCRLYAGRHRDPDLQQWSARVGTWRQAAETMWLVPSSDCFFHPEFRADGAARQP